MQIFLEHPQRNINKKPARQEIIWYDTFFKTLRKFDCSKLKYLNKKVKYITLSNGEKISYEDASEDQKKAYVAQEKYITVAEPEYFDISVSGREKDKSATKKAILDYVSYNNVDIDVERENDEGCLVECEFNGSQQADFLYFMDRLGIRFNILG